MRPPLTRPRRLDAMVIVLVLSWIGVLAACGESGPQPGRTEATPTGETSAPPEHPHASLSPSPDETEPVPLVEDEWSEPNDLHRGLAVLAYSSAEATAVRENARQLLDRAVRLGVNTVSLNIPIYQADARASELHRDDATPSNEALRAFVEEAHRRRLAVMLRPLLDEASLQDTGDWRGSIQPADTGAWFRSYEDLMVEFAELAQDSGTEILNVGSEFSSLQGHESRWRALIERVREVYSGYLTYSTNWDIGPVSFVDALDFPSIDAFFPLDVPRQPSTEEMADAWNEVLTGLRDEGYELDNLVFTEIGVTAQVGAPQQPLVWDHGTPRDEELRARYYAASCQALVPELGGLYWWAADINHPAGTDTDPTFDPIGELAEEVIRDCFSDDLRDGDPR